MVKHGALSKSRVYQLLRSKDARVRRAAFILLETSNPSLRRNSEVFLEVIRFIWNANPNYDVYREFSKRHLLVPFKVHELISARLKIEKREQQSAVVEQRTKLRRLCAIVSTSPDFANNRIRRADNPTMKLELMAVIGLHHQRGVFAR